VNSPSISRKALSLLLSILILSAIAVYAYYKWLVSINTTTSTSNSRLGFVIVNAEEQGVGCVKIVLKDTEFTINNTRFYGFIILSLYNESKAISLGELKSKRGVSVVCFNDGVRKAIESMQRLYSSIGASIDFNSGVKGLSGSDVISRFAARGVGGVAMPTITINMWLYDDKGSTYMITDFISPLDYYISVLLNYAKAFEESFRDPFIHIRRGLTVIIPPLSELYKHLAKIDLKPYIEKIRNQASLENKELSTLIYSEDNIEPLSIDYLSPRGCQFLVPSDGIYAEDFWKFTYYPPKFWYDRVIAPNTDSLTYSWYCFVTIYSTVYLYSKLAYPTPERVLDLLDDYTCTSPGLHSMDEIVSNCVNPKGIKLSWKHTLDKGYRFIFKKPYVIDASLIRYLDIPDLKIIFAYGSFRGGFKSSGITFAGQYLTGGRTQFVQSGVGSLALIIPYELKSKNVRYAALIIPSEMEYLGDYLALYWCIGEYKAPDGREYWVAIPIPTIILYYQEVIELGSESWRTCYYDASGNLLGPVNCDVHNILTYLREVTEYLSRDPRVIFYKAYSDIPLYADVIVDYNKYIGAYYYENLLASVAFGVLKWAIELLFEGPVEPFVGLISTFISYSDIAFSADAVEYKLIIGKMAETSSRISIIIEKDAPSTLSEAFYEIGRVPLAIAYRVYTDRDLASPPPCPPDDPSCKISVSLP
jgi:hypothetical protein